MAIDYGILGCIKRACPEGLGRWSSPSTLPWWGHIWNTMSISGLPSSSRENPAGGRKDDRELGNSAMWGTADRTWDCSVWRRLRGVLISVYKYLMVGVKWMGPTFFWWCWATVQGEAGTNWNTGSSIQKAKRKAFLRVTQHWNRLPRELGNSAMWGTADRTLDCSVWRRLIGVLISVYKYLMVGVKWMGPTFFWWCW